MGQVIANPAARVSREGGSGAARSREAGMGQVIGNPVARVARKGGCAFGWCLMTAHGPAVRVAGERTWAR